MLDKNAAFLFHRIIHKLSTASAELYAQHIPCPVLVYRQPGISA